MAKHKARFWENPSPYIPDHVLKAYERFAYEYHLATLTGDWGKAQKSAMRGRTGSRVRAMSDVVRTVRLPRKWW